jgi:hypothetical protein
MLLDTCLMLISLALLAVCIRGGIVLRRSGLDALTTESECAAPEDCE